jgi:hypothetical protein
MIHMHCFYNFLEINYVSYEWVASIHRVSEKAHSRKSSLSCVALCVVRGL